MAKALKRAPNATGMGRLKRNGRGDARRTEPVRRRCHFGNAKRQSEPKANWQIRSCYASLTTLWRWCGRPRPKRMKWRLIMIRLPPPPSEEGSATGQHVRFGHRRGSSGYELLA